MSTFHCSVPKCQVKKRQKTSIFNLPTHLETRKLWISFLEKQGMIFKEECHVQICELHFKKENIILRNTRKMLKPGSIPNDDYDMVVIINKITLRFLPIK